MAIQTMQVINQVIKYIPFILMAVIKFYNHGQFPDNQYSNLCFKLFLQAIFLTGVQ